MPSKSAPRKAAATLHPRNRHQGRYDFEALSKLRPELRDFLIHGREHNLTLDFTHPAAVKALNRALLQLHYRVRDWDIPDGYLCPPVPGRADYVHALADLIGESHDGQIPRGPQLTGLDIGTGANLIYPLIGNSEYGWCFVGADIDAPALTNARRIIAANPGLSDQIEVRLQPDQDKLLHSIIGADELFDFTLCNPPFYADAQEARQANKRKWRNLEQQHGKQLAPHQSFGGQASELYCPGGEAAFLARLIKESSEFSTSVFWFSSLVSRGANLDQLQQQLRQLGARDVRVVPMSQGLKHSRMLAWTFLDKKQRRAWRRARWNQQHC